MNKIIDDEHLDPITDTPGAHPVGVGIGATLGAIGAGAAMGAIAGPAGALFGAAVGAIAGGLGGKAYAEDIDPTDVEARWRPRFEMEPYHVSGALYDDYAPAYRLGTAARQNYKGREYSEVRDDIASYYDHVRGKSRLNWDQAEPAVKAAWVQANL